MNPLRSFDAEEIENVNPTVRPQPRTVIMFLISVSDTRAGEESDDENYYLRETNMRCQWKNLVNVLFS